LFSEKSTVINIEKRIISVFNLFLGIRFYYRMRQYPIPKFMNKRWYKLHMHGFDGMGTRKFLRFYREKLWLEKRRAQKCVAIIFLNIYFD
jgi:hypothetical protein